MNDSFFEIQQRDLAVLIEEHGETVTLTQNKADTPFYVLVCSFPGAPNWVREYRQRDETNWFVARVVGSDLPTGLSAKVAVTDSIGTKFTMQDFKPIGRPHNGKFVGYMLALVTNTRLGGL